jgi:hypothetical protein
MGYYEPSFGNLDSGWYFSTNDERYGRERDALLRHWTSRCDALLKEYLLAHGMFFVAFEKEISRRLKTILPEGIRVPGYFGYFIKSRVLVSAEMRDMYLRDFDERGKQVTTCQACGATQFYDDIHPSLVGRTGKVMPLCNKCWFWAAHLENMDADFRMSEDLIEKIRSLSSKQQCVHCGRDFQWVTDKVRYTFDLPFLPRRFTQFCPRCVNKAFAGKQGVPAAVYLPALKRISEIIKSIPERDSLAFDEAESLADARSVLDLMLKMPRFGDIAKEQGSWFKALVASGVLADGTRRTHFGTMVVARDGHECLSLAEKTVDDLMFLSGIPHQKEVQYPDSNFRADWSIEIAGRTVLIELFGLDGQPEYTKRMTEKIRYAAERGLELIALDRADLNRLRAAFEKKILAVVKPARVRHA